jgi:hypothetical protein
MTQKNKFENVEINQIVSFQENEMIESGVVDYVCDKMFTLRVLSTWDNNGVLVIYHRNLNFFKSGKKTNRYYTYGDALEIVGNVNQTL